MSDLFFFSSTSGQKSADRLKWGGKGAGLMEMSSMGLPVPPGFILSTSLCREFLKQGLSLSPRTWEEVKNHLKKLEDLSGRSFGSESKPLLVSVRSGAPQSMPGMMDTILNLGLNEKSTLALAQEAQDECFAWDCYRRFVQMYAHIVLEVNYSFFDSTLEDLKEARHYNSLKDLKPQDYQDLIKVYKEIILDEAGVSFPEDPWEQLQQAICAVFKSWNNPRAIKYRQIQQIESSLGTAVNIQQMVFGNLGEGSLTGVCFSRNPATGERHLFGEYLLCAQGEDIVAGTHTPQPFNRMSGEGEYLEDILPEIYQKIEVLSRQLEESYGDIQDIEFTVEQGKLFLLQSRRAKRTAGASVRIARDFEQEGLVSPKQALLMIDPLEVEKILHPSLDHKQTGPVIAKGLPASPGAASGPIALSLEKLKELLHQDQTPILVRVETSPDDIEAMKLSQGILTAKGGMTSHAAVVARGMGVPCIAGCQSLAINLNQKKIRLGEIELTEGEVISFDGGSGEIFRGAIPLIPAEPTPSFRTVMKWAKEYKKLGVRVNADTPEEALIAKKFGAQGIGLCRTEHMFFSPSRLNHMRQMIFAQSSTERLKALAHIKPFMQNDFLGIFYQMDGLAVTIRLLDPPLHEFLPHKDEEIEQMAENLKMSPAQARLRIKALSEMNPMLGLRGCRLGLIYPEIYEMQVEAILEAAIKTAQLGHEVKLEIMLPLACTEEEVIEFKKLVEVEAKKVFDKKGQSITFLIGTMIELPRACLVADKIAKHVDFFSFGSNDLTQTTLGISRDDSGSFLPYYTAQGIFSQDPFMSIDQEGVGELMKIAVKKGRSVNPTLKIGICGEHGGEAKSIEFAHHIGLDYVSCSCYRLPVAQLAAAQANLK